ncbi:hypothetical protein GCM10008967_25870 [Bacillus carboniphilus]|uniref:Prepilin-type N-terminal cleavage/methylation domain-containing protein n=1 Tax=Bacillus carboniphilus TaxID=86663 RepID=A0ABN0WDP0_9BACI
MQRIKQAWKNEKGLTLVELLAVVVILGIIAAIAVPSIGGIIENSKRDAHIANAQQMISSAKLVAASEISSRGDGEYYVSLTYLVEQGYLDTFENPFDDNAYDTISTGATEIIDIVAGDTAPTTGSFVFIDKDANKFSYKVTLDADTGNEDYDIDDRTEDQLTRESAFSTE